MKCLHCLAMLFCFFGVQAGDGCSRPGVGCGFQQSSSSGKPGRASSASCQRDAADAFRAVTFQRASMPPALTRRVVHMLERLYHRHHREVDWYFMVDDDTFVRPYPLLAFLRSVGDPSEPHMIGNPVDSTAFLRHDKSRCTACRPIVAVAQDGS